jgi:hypothetical protein
LSDGENKIGVKQKQLDRFQLLSQYKVKGYTTLACVVIDNKNWAHSFKSEVKYSNTEWYVQPPTGQRNFVLHSLLARSC